MMGTVSTTLITHDICKKCNNEAMKWENETWKVFCRFIFSKIAMLFDKNSNDVYDF